MQRNVFYKARDLYYGICASGEYQIGQEPKNAKVVLKSGIFCQNS